jgi:bacterioferritin-associated ferredoxin
MFVCSCKAVTESRVQALGRAGVLSAPALIDALGLDEPGCCGRCVRDIEQIAAVARRAALPLEFVGYART